MEQTFTGQEINGYRIGPLLGIGGMGEVYQAFPDDSDQGVAIKFLRAEFSEDAKIQGRFMREIRILQALQHENIVSIIDHGLVDGQVLYYTMQLVTGMPLSMMFKRQRFSPLMYWEVLRQISSALGFAHENNVVHRDIKPSNIFVQAKDGGGLHLFLGDFGLGKREGVDHTLTEAGSAFGTPHYMSPEAILGDKPSQLSDIYAMAVLTFEALLGRMPFEHDFPHQVAMAHVTEPVPDIHELNPDFPECIQDIIVQGMAKSSEERQPTMNDFAEAYRECLKSLPEESRTKMYHVADPSMRDDD